MSAETTTKIRTDLGDSQKIFQRDPKLLSHTYQHISSVRSQPSARKLPVCSPKHPCSTRHSIGLSRIRLHSDSPSKLDTQQMIHHFEPLLPLRKIHAANVHYALELALRMVAKESKDRNDARWRNVESQFVPKDGELLDKSWETLNQVGSVCV
jgi:hypothetical protein